MAHLPNPQNITHLSVMFQGEFAKKYPNVRFEPTLTPKGEDYVSLTERVFEIDPHSKRILNFYGYVEYRICEVRRKSRMQFLPVFSSIEVRGYGHEQYVGGKVHFAPHKVMNDDPALYADAEHEAHVDCGADPTLDIDEEIAYQVGRRCYAKAVKLIDDLNRRLAVQP